MTIILMKIHNSNINIIINNNKTMRRKTGLSRNRPVTTFKTPKPIRKSRGLMADLAAAFRSAGVGRHPLEARPASRGSA